MKTRTAMDNEASKLDATFTRFNDLAIVRRFRRTTGVLNNVGQRGSRAAVHGIPVEAWRRVF